MIPLISATPKVLGSPPDSAKLTSGRGSGRRRAGAPRRSLPTRPDAGFPGLFLLAIVCSFAGSPRSPRNSSSDSLVIGIVSGTAGPSHEGRILSRRIQQAEDIAAEHLRLLLLGQLEE